MRIRLLTERWIRNHSYSVYSLAQLQLIISLDTLAHFFHWGSHKCPTLLGSFHTASIASFYHCLSEINPNCISVQMQISYKSSLIRTRHRGMAWCCFLSNRCIPCFHKSLSMWAYITNRFRIQFRHISCTMCSSVPWRQFTLLQPTLAGCSTFKWSNWLTS